jgi:uncharacterized LabA/DUF88 family protein
MIGKDNKKANYAFIDNQNLNLGVQKTGFKMNWRKFREFLRDNYNVEKAYMFIGYMANYEELYEQMHDLGYLVVLKPTVGMFNEPDKTKDEQKPVVKGNVDAELVLHAVKEMPNYNKAIIVSGDGDFYSLIEFLLEQNKLLNVLTPNRQYSSLLKHYEKYIIRLDQYKKELRYYTKK